MMMCFDELVLYRIDFYLMLFHVVVVYHGVPDICDDVCPSI